MRTYLMLFVTLALLASYGCSGKSTPTRVSQNTDNAAPADSGPSGRLGLAGGPGAPADPSEGKGKEEDEGESKDGDKESSDDENKEDSEESTSEEAAEKAPPKRKFDPTDRRRGQKGRPGMAGGASQTTPPPETKSGNSKAGDSEEKEEEKEEPKEEEKEPEEKIVTLYDRAVKAFAKDHDTEAFQYLYAYYLTDEEALKNHPPKWFDGVKEPRVALRWGIGVDYNDGGYDGEPPVIGDPVSDSGNSGNAGSNRAGNGGRRGGGGGGGDFGNSGGGGMTVQGGKRKRSTDRRRSNPSSPNNNSEPARLPSETLEYYTGDFGEMFVKRYEMRLPRKFYGSIMHAVAESSANGDAQEDEEDDNSQASQSQQLPGGGDFGTMGGNSMAPPRGNGNGRNNDQDSDEDYEADPTSLAPGLMMVGVGNKKQLLENAKSLNLDVLAIFEVKIRHSERRNGDTSTKSNTRLALYSVKTGEAIDTDSKSLSNLAVASARDKDREDPVELELDKVFSNMADDKFKAKDLPASLDSDIAGKRYEFLLSKKHSNPLPVLVEIKYYVDAGLISKNNYFAACEQLLGDVEAQDLIDGNIKQKERALEKYLPGNYEVNFESGSEENFR